MSFEFAVPTSVVFGDGCANRVGEYAAAHGSRALLLCGRSAMRRHGVLDRVVGNLRAAGVGVGVFDAVSPDPRSDEVVEAATRCRREGVDVLVGLGGGSALDAAKATSVAVAGPPVGALIGRTLGPDTPALPVIAVPTTAGSGAEVTKGAIITDVERHAKAGIRGPALFPEVALIDPELTATMPRSVAAETGFDALTHAVEGFVARRRSPLTDLAAQEGIRRLAANLGRLAAGNATPSARAQLSYAALLGGVVVANASTCLPHRLQQAMGAVPRIGLSHGRGLAALYPPWLERAYRHVPERFDRIAALLGGTDIRAVVGNLLDTLGLRLSLREAGVRREDVPTLVEAVEGNVDNDPIDGIDETVLRELYLEAW